MGARIKTTEKANRLPLAVVGHIKCGMKSDRGFPMSTDYFLADGNYASLFNSAYGEKPNRIQIVFPSDDEELVCKEYYSLRDTAGKLVAEGDGETFKVYSSKTQSYITLSTEQYPNLMEDIKGKYPKCEWKITLTLRFLLPLVRGVAGIWELSTKGAASSVNSIRDTFDAFKEQNGHISGVIFDLSVKMHQSQKPQCSSRYPVLSLVPNESAENLMLVKEARKPIMLTD